MLEKMQTMMKTKRTQPTYRSGELSTNTTCESQWMNKKKMTKSKVFRVDLSSFIIHPLQELMKSVEMKG